MSVLVHMHELLPLQAGLQKHAACAAAADLHCRHQPRPLPSFNTAIALHRDVEAQIEKSALGAGLEATEGCSFGVHCQFSHRTSYRVGSTFMSVSSFWVCRSGCCSGVLCPGPPARGLWCSQPMASARCRACGESRRLRLRHALSLLRGQRLFSLKEPACAWLAGTGCYKPCADVQLMWGSFLNGCCCCDLPYD